MCPLNLFHVLMYDWLSGVEINPHLKDTQNSAIIEGMRNFRIKVCIISSLCTFSLLCLFRYVSYINKN